MLCDRQPSSIQPMAFSQKPIQTPRVTHNSAINCFNCMKIYQHKQKHQRTLTKKFVVCVRKIYLPICHQLSISSEIHESMEVNQTNLSRIEF